MWRQYVEAVCGGSMWRQDVKTCLVRSRSGAPKFGAQCVAANIWGCIGVMGLRSL
jgi:hypothetical protein